MFGHFSQTRLLGLCYSSLLPATERLYLASPPSKTRLLIQIILNIILISRKGPARSLTLCFPQHQPGTSLYLSSLSIQPSHVSQLNSKELVPYHLTLIRMAISKKSTNNKCWRGRGEKGPSYTVGGNVNWCSHYGEQCGWFLKKLKIELPFDPAIPLLGVYPEKTIIRKDTCTPMFIAAPFTIARTWKQPKCPLTMNG